MYQTDAGGARGISQLKILTELMHRFNYEVEEDKIDRPCTIFDMIGGTGSGGFIAILLSILGLTAEQALEDFVELCAAVLDIQGMDADARTTALKTYVESLMEKYSVSEDMRLMDPNDRAKGCKLVLPISYKHNIGMRCTLRNYIVRHERAPNTTVREALLATLATPPLFTSTSILHDTDMLEIMGADLTLSNPVGDMVSEAYAAFAHDQQVACLLSIGCGHPGVVSPPSDSNLASWNRFLETLVADGEQKARVMDSQMGHLGLYYRLSVTTGLERAASVVSPGVGAVFTHAAVYLADPSVTRKVDSCVESLRARDGVASLEQLKRSGGESALAPAPPPLTRTFVMRKEPWEFIEKAILGVGRSEEDEDGPRMLAVTGMGGCGKTQLVLKFMRVHENKFASRFFIDGSSRARIRADTLQHVRSLGSEYSQKDFDECLLFLTQPSPNGPRLILYDNVDDPDLDLGPLLPRGDACAIIITSRNWSISELCPDSHLELDVMSTEEAVELLLHNPNRSREINNREREDLVRITEALGCLPIALAQARSYMYQTKCSGSEYLTRLISTQNKLLAQPIKNQRDMRYSSTYAAFDASFERLTPRTQRLLRLLSYFHWSKFPVELVSLAAKYHFSQYRMAYVDNEDEYVTAKEALENIFLHEETWSITDIDEMIVSLQNYSLVSLVRGIDTTLLQMHPLTHTWVHSCVSEEQRVEYRSAAVLLLALGARDEHTPSAQYLASHVMHMTHLWERLSINDAAAFGHILHDGGLSKEALQLQERVVTELRSRDVSHVRNLPDALSSLAIACYGCGRLAEAERLQEEVLRLSKASVGEHHLDTIKASTTLAVTYCELGRLKEAEELQSQVVQLSKDLLGERHPRTIKASNYLATTYRDLGMLKEAEELQVEVLRLNKEVLGERHRNTIWAMGNLANTHRSLGRLSEAEQLQETVLTLRKELLGERHPDTINASNNLALTYRAQGRMKKAEELQVEVMQLRKEILGERHPHTIEAADNLGTTRHHLSRLDECEPLRVEVLRLRKEVLGDRHPDTLVAANNLAWCYRDLGRLEEAETIQVATLTLMREILGNYHFETIEAANCLGSTYHHLDRLDECEALCIEVLRLRTEILGDRHPDTLMAANNLAWCYRDLGRLDEAEAMQVKTVALSREILGDRHTDTAAAMLTLAEIYESQCKKTLALNLLDLVATSVSEELGTQHELYLGSQAIKERVQSIENTSIPGTTVGVAGSALLYVAAGWRRALALIGLATDADGPHTSLN